MYNEHFMSSSYSLIHAGNGYCCWSLQDKCNPDILVLLSFDCDIIYRIRLVFEKWQVSLNSIWYLFLPF